MVSSRFPRVSLPWFLFLVACLSVVLVFFAPLRFPPTHLTYSTSYAVGFSNRLATLSMLGLSLAVLAGVFVWGRPLRLLPPDADRLSRGWLGLAWAVSAMYTVVFSWLMVRSGSSTADVDYYVIPLAEVAYEHGRVYRSAEFAYGPLMFDLPALMQRGLGLLGVRPLLGYLAANLVSQLGGLAILFYILQRLPLRRPYRLVALAVFLFGSLRPALGMNYTMMRFGAAFALLLWVMGVEKLETQAVLFGGAQALTFAISPEVGISFLAGAWSYAAVRTWREGRRFALLALGPLVGGAAFFALVDRGYFYVISHFATGMLNQVIAPVPNILILLAATVFVAPIAVANLLRKPAREAALGAGLYMAALAMIPAGLGLCDDLHTFFNGAGMFLLSLVAASQYEGWWPRVWAVALFAFTVMPTWPDSLGVARQEAGRVYRPDPGVEAIERRVADLPAGELVYAPAGAPGPLRDELMATRRWAPSFFSGINNAFDVAGDQRKVGEMRRAMYVLMPGVMLPDCSADNRWRVRLLRFGYQYRNRRRPYQPLTLVRQALQADFAVDSRYEVQGLPVVLYRRVGAPVRVSPGSR